MEKTPVLPEHLIRLQLLSPEQAGKLLGILPDTLAKWRHLRKGPKYIKVGHNSVMYRLQDLEAFIAARVNGAPEPPKRRKR